MLVMRASRTVTRKINSKEIPFRFQPNKIGQNFEEFRSENAFKFLKKQTNNTNVVK